MRKYYGGKGEPEKVKEFYNKAKVLIDKQELEIKLERKNNTINRITNSVLGK